MHGGETGEGYELAEREGEGEESDEETVVDELSNNIPSPPPGTSQRITSSRRESETGWSAYYEENGITLVSTTLFCVAFPVMGLFLLFVFLAGWLHISLSLLFCILLVYTLSVSHSFAKLTPFNHSFANTHPLYISCCSHYQQHIT